MNKLLYISIILVLLFGCEKSDDESHRANEFLLHMEGRYVLKEMYSEEPLDLNFDDVYNTDMFEEMDCQVVYPLELYDASVEYHVSSNRLELMFEVSNSQVYSESEPYQQCFFNQSLYYSKILVDEGTDDINVITSGTPEREEEYGYLTGGQYNERKLHLNVDKILFTSEGWQTVPIHIIYEWNNP